MGWTDSVCLFSEWPEPELPDNIHTMMATTTNLKYWATFDRHHDDYNDDNDGNGNDINGSVGCGG